MVEKKELTDTVIIIGAGINGCRVALELADLGFKVYLIEKNPCKFMVQSEKSIQSDNCAMCILAPKLIEVDKHPNIELIMNAEIVSLKGKPGNFNILVHKNKTVISEERCKEELIYKIDSDNGFSQTLPLKILVKKRNIPPCENACPAHVNSQEYIDLISKGKYLESLNIIRERCPLPLTIGRICNHPCEIECNRGKVDEPINICGLKRFVADYVRENIKEKAEFIEEKKDKKVAIIGSGASGLTVAYHLARKGYPITIFEKEEVAGGMLRLCIPEYRLPSDILDADIEHIKRFGVEIKVNTQIGPPGPTIKDLLEEFDAVFIGVGLPKSRNLNIEGEDLKNVILGIDFLKNCKLGKNVQVGKKVIVIGGGNVAIDVARTALRKGAKEIHLVMLESEDIIPAHPWEISEAKEEGIIFHTSRGPKRFIGKDGKVIGLETLFCSSVFDENGRFNPVLEACTEKVVEGDMAIITIGQRADLEFLDKEIKVGRGIEIDRNTFQTSIPGVFAGGEIVKGPGSAIESIATGNKAAIIIEKYLKGIDISTITETIPDYEEDEIVTLEDIEELKKMFKEPRRSNEILPPDIRKNNFNEIMIGLDENSALEESNRCLSCGICDECFECVKTCIGNTISHELIDEPISINVGSVILTSGDDWLFCFDYRRGTNYRWQIISPTAFVEDNICIGCGECVDICLFGAIERIENITEFNIRRNTPNPMISLVRYKSQINTELCKGCGACIGVCPVGALSLKHFTKEDLIKIIKL
ncbi:MAG: FAD-dependent oxidoreductase [Candidatus Helarchaeota archaeon]